MRLCAIRMDKEIWDGHAAQSQGSPFLYVQIGSLGELEILAAMVKEYGKPVHLTFNALYYIPEQYPEIAEMIKKCMRIGFDSYIIADPALILYLRNSISTVRFI